jgi:RHS repeat-associated protein
LKCSYDSRGDAPNVEDFSGTLTGTTAHYGYDYNGNLNLDDYKGLSITYNDNNLPQELDFGNNNIINYFYDATGEKLLRFVGDSLSNTNLTYYFGPFVHEGELGGTSSLKYIMTPEGRIINKGTDGSPIWSWEYNLTDHLGNVRVVIAPLGTAGFSNVLQQTHYYPFGMSMSQISTSTGTDNDYLFGGKQIERNFDLGWINYGKRLYDPYGRLGFTSADPMSELNYPVSTYAYCRSNPVRSYDPTGMYSLYFNGEEVDDDDAKSNLRSRMGLPKDNEGNNDEEPTTLMDNVNEFFNSINPFSVPIGPGHDGERKKVENNIKNTTENVNYVSKFIVINGALFVLTEGMGYAVEAIGGRIMLRALGKEALKGVEIAANSGGTLVETASGILKPGGSIIGEVGSNASIREFSGGIEVAQNYWSRLVNSGAKPVLGSNYKGVLMELPNGGTVGFRTVMTRSPGTAATIDVNIPGLFQGKLKFNP